VTFPGSAKPAKHRPWTTQRDRQPDTGNIARAYATGQAQHQCLERADLAGTLLHAIAESTRISGTHASADIVAQKRQK